MSSTQPENAVHAVVSNQDGLYRNLEETVLKYASTRYLRPIADHTRKAFDEVKQFVENFYRSQNNEPQMLQQGGSYPRTIILDSGCGVGESTLHLARKFPGAPVIGIDKSAVRLAKAGNEKQLQLLNDKESHAASNAFWVRAELLDFWRLALYEVQAGRWQIQFHAIYYPNPWPKESEATRRFHLHPIFPALLALSPKTELRTNWEIYAREFAEAARIVNAHAHSGTPTVSESRITCEPFIPEEAETAFERKYKEAHQQLWRVFVIQ